MKKNFSTFICLFCFFVFPLKAEIQEIVMKWNALLCLNSCEPFLKDQLNNIVGIQAVQISARAGTAVMGWAPDQPFSYAPFNLATRTVGIRIADFRLKVLGLVRQAQDSFYLYSPSDLCIGFPLSDLFRAQELAPVNRRLLSCIACLERPGP